MTSSAAGSRRGSERGKASNGAAPFSLVLATVVQALITAAIEEWTGIPGELDGILTSDSTRNSSSFDKKLSAKKED
jgi:hypothetical protein